MEYAPTFLAGKLLVAMPSMSDPRFERAVILMCAHSEDGALGLMVNRVATGIEFTELLERLEIACTLNSGGPPIYVGGPVEHGRGFVLHSSEYQSEGTTLQIDSTFGMTATLDVLRDIATGHGPRSALLALGYSGWAPGQLESEMQANGWLSCDADEDIVFDIDPEERWAAALDRIGIDPRLLSSTGGSA